MHCPCSPLSRAKPHIPTCRQHPPETPVGQVPGVRPVGWGAAVMAAT